MELKRSEDGKALDVALIGVVDAANITEIEEAVKKELDGVTELTFDMKELEYISSAGLRFLLKMHKTMKSKGTMWIRNVNDDVKDIFRITGFLNHFNITA